MPRARKPTPRDQRKVNLLLFRADVEAATKLAASEPSFRGYQTVLRRACQLGMRALTAGNKKLID